MGPLVVNAAGLVEFLLAAESGRSVGRFLESGADLHVPEVCDVEIVSAIERWERLGLISSDEAQDALLDYVDMPLIRHRHFRLLGRAYALRDNFSAHDAVYVALAEQFGATLVTTDRRLARAVRRHTAVEVVP